VLCRIDVRRDNEWVVVHVAGHLSEKEVPDLLASAAAADSPRVVLALDELVSADAVGVDALLRIERNGARLEGLPEYLRLELDELERTRRR
jgi:anti-anti-sigma regulatory factor